MKKLNIIVAILIAIIILFVAVLTIKSVITGTDITQSEETPPVTATNTPDGNETPDIGDIADSTPDIGDPTPPPVTGESFTTTSPVAGEKLTLTIDTAAFTHEQTQDGDLFYAIDDLSREVFIEITYVAGDMEPHKYSLIENYLPGIDNIGENDARVASSDVIAFMSTASGNGRSVDAWLKEVELGFFAIVVGYKTQEQGELIYRMLDTLVFEQ